MDIATKNIKKNEKKKILIFTHPFRNIQGLVVIICQFIIMINFMGLPVMRWKKK